MIKTKPRPAPSKLIECLESRQLLSASIGTVTTLAAPTSTLIGQDFTVTVDVKDINAAAVSVGTVSLLSNGMATGLTAPLNSTGEALFHFGAGNALYAGNYLLTASFLGNTVDTDSTSAGSSLSISLPSLTYTGDNLGWATVTAGSGAGAVTGQNLNMLYTGFYQDTGAEFDESLAHSPGTFNFTLNASPEQVISGFDEGSTGITIGETRVLVIPSDLGYNDGKVRLFVIQSLDPAAVPFGTPAQLNIASVPASAAVDTATTSPLRVAVLDSNDALVQTDASSVTLSIADGPAGATLGGTTTVAAQSGAASFSDFTFSEAGTYILSASDGALGSAVSGPITVGATPPSTLVPTLGNVVLPATTVAGSKISARIPVVVTNQGSAINGKVTVSLFADTGTTLDGNQVQLASQTRRLPLKTNRGSAFNFILKSVPSTLSAAIYHVLAEVLDPAGATNLIATGQTITVAAPFVQPVVTLASVTPVSIATGKIGTLIVTITNAGNIPAKGLTATIVPYTTDLVPVSGIVLGRIHSAPPLAAGKSRVFRVHFKVTGAFPVGSYLPNISATLGGVSAALTGTVPFAVG